VSALLAMGPNALLVTGSAHVPFQGRGTIDVAPLGGGLFMTPRTLQRRLAKAGTSFETLRDDARRHAAEVYLSNATLSITEVAYLLGYSEPAAFHRAFKRWHRSVTPQAFRAIALAATDKNVSVNGVAKAQPESWR